jgi:hypothetical protein
VEHVEGVVVEAAVHVEHRVVIVGVLVEQLLQLAHEATKTLGALVDAVTVTQTDDSVVRVRRGIGRGI